MPSKNARVLGPYPNGTRWRLVVFQQNSRKALLTDTREEAAQLRIALERRFHDPSRITIGAALDDYLTARRRIGLTESTLFTIESKLRPFLPLDRSVGDLTAEQAVKMYQAETQRAGRFGIIRAATHHKVLRHAKAFFAWAVERRYILENPFAALKPVGKASAGKPQLRQDEVRKLKELLLSRAGDGEESALAVLVQLAMGLRSSEVLALRVRDLDAGGTVLCIEGTKNKNARRALTIEWEPLRILLVRHCASRPPEALIFGSGRSKPYATDYLFKSLRKLCELAGVPCVCPHSLRGLHASLAVAHGASSRFVAEALGHGSDAITKRHYITKEALHSANLKRVAAVLSSNTDSQPAPDLDSLAKLLRTLTPTQLETLLASVITRR